MKRPSNGVLGERVENLENRWSSPMEPKLRCHFSLLWLTAAQSPVSDSLGIPTISSVARPVNTKAFTAIYPRKCYATTNFLDPDLDFLGLRQKVTCPITAAFTRR